MTVWQTPLWVDQVSDYALGLDKVELSINFPGAFSNPPFHFPDAFSNHQLLPCCLLQSSISLPWCLFQSPVHFPAAFSNRQFTSFVPFPIPSSFPCCLFQSPIRSKVRSLFNGLVHWSHVSGSEPVIAVIEDKFCGFWTDWALLFNLTTDQIGLLQ